MPKGKYIYYWYEYKWPPVRYDYVEELATQVLRHFYYYYYYYYMCANPILRYAKPARGVLKPRVVERVFRKPRFGTESPPSVLYYYYYYYYYYSQ